MARSKEYDENIVLHRAMKLFWHQGYEKTSMQDLVAHMGIHRRSIYDNFGSKHALYMKALERYAETVEANLETQIKTLDSVKQGIRLLFEVAVHRKEHQPSGCFTVNTAVELAEHDREAMEKVMDRFSNTENLLHELVLCGQTSGEISDRHEAERLAQFLNNSLVGVRVLAKTSHDTQKMEEIIDVTLSVLD
ncbi:TetR/AcrR family transcriptional regulator [Salicibibacter halophilus]|uniref:TetR/AcrR family transcriptional regulator n=1 Tax=Salicibibacter halophilus TaxID=2502791 RepID=A0A514LE52_9BACI|nr:TetR/AcrR family transcriptional regulator [Salicibibacter halophilus]QDI90132.1 TetR/AcrR family transcriptional regulator [Salicibibacter halophilus]